jgi:hypothetical protein
VNRFIGNEGASTATAIHQPLSEQIHHCLASGHTTYFEASGDLNFGWD